jgi:cell division protein FtsA
LLVDVGFITTSVAISRGNALLSLGSFSMGGGYITSDLSQCLKISFSEAERLKRKVVVGWNPKQSDTYEIEGDEHLQSYAAKATNEIVSDRVEMICDYINRCLDGFMYDLPEFLPIHFVGGGFNFIQGVKTVLNKKLNRKVEMINSIGHRDIRPHDASEEGLLNFILNYDYLLNEILVNV